MLSGHSENDLYYPGIFVWDGETAIQVSEGYHPLLEKVWTFPCGYLPAPVKKT